MNNKFHIIGLCSLFALLPTLLPGAQDSDVLQEQILTAYFDLFAGQWAPDMQSEHEHAGSTEWRDEDTEKYFPAVARANPKTDEDWRKLAQTDKREMLAAYYAMLGPDAAPDAALIRPLADFVIGTGGNAETLAQAVERALPGQVIALPAGRHTGETDVSKDLILVGLGGSKETLVTGELDFPLIIRGGDVLVCGLSFEFRGRNGTRKYAFCTSEGDTTVVSCRADSDTLSGFVAMASSRVRYMRCMAEKNRDSGFFWYESAHIVALGCIAAGNRLDGFGLYDEPQATLSRCVSTVNGQAGYMCKGRSQLTLTRCLSSENGGSGYRVLMNARMIAKACLSIKNGQIGYSADDKSRMTLDRCLSKENTRCGFVIFNDARLKAENCRSSGNGSNGFEFQGTSRSVLMHCLAKDNAGNGFAAYDYCRLEGRHLRACDNRACAIRTDGSSSAELAFFGAVGNGSGNAPESAGSSRITCEYSLTE
jgi:hypothetical protein